jgi:hypothetical protein
VELTDCEPDRGEGRPVEFISSAGCLPGADADKLRERVVVQESEKQVVGSDSIVSAAFCYLAGYFDGDSGSSSESFKHRYRAFRIWRAPTAG